VIASSESIIGRAFARPSGKNRHSDQEQIQMIAAAIASQTECASVARANSESRFAWGRTSGNEWRYSLEPRKPR